MIDRTRTPSKIIIPESYTDFIFPEFVATFGWAFGLIMIGVYGMLIFKMLSIARNIITIEKKISVIGFASIFMFLFFENIGMVIGVMPVTGVVLPFVSYGVSAMITYMMIIGITLNFSKEEY